MLKNKYLWIAVVMLLLAAGAFFAMKKTALPVQPGPVVVKTGAPAVNPVASPKDPVILEKREVSDEFKDPRLKVLTQQDEYTPSLEELAGFLNAHQRSQDALLAAFAVCKDQRILEELMTSAPNERTYQAVMLWSDDDEASDKAIQALQTLNPKNPMPYLIGMTKGAELTPEDLKKTQKALGDDPVFDVSSLRQPALRNEAWQSVVKDPVKAWAYSLQSMNLDLETIDTLSNGILNFQTASQTDENPNNISGALALTQALRKDDGEISSISDSKENSLELEILGTVDADSRYPGSKQTVQQRIDQLEAKIEKEGDTDEKMQAFLREAEPAKVEAFIQVWNEKGMNEALKGLDDGAGH